MLDSVGSQALLVGHHIALRMYMGNEFHGFFSLLISLFYISIMIANSGFDNSIASVWSYYTSSRNRFFAFLKLYCLPQAILIVAMSICLYGAYTSLLYKNLIPILDKINTPLLFILLATFITESLKKTVKYFLQLSFYNELTALVEFFGMIAYISAIWTTYSITHQLTQFSCFMYLLIVSSVQLSLLIGGLIYQYRHLSYEIFPVDYLFSRTQKNRVFIFGNQLANQFFSSNALVPACAFMFGLHIASLIKIVTSISQWIILVAQKIVGISTIALLSQTKQNNDRIKKYMFLYSNTILQQILYALLIFLLINGRAIVQFQTEFSTIISLPVLYFLLSMSFIESFFIAYEKWFIIEEKTYLFFAINSTCLAILYCAAQYIMQCGSSISLVMLLTTFTTIRLSGFLILALYAHTIWNITPKLSVRLSTITTALIVSSAFYSIVYLLSKNG